MIMPKVEINGKEMHAELHENLLDVARREKVHIGFSCGGNGACQTCEVIIAEGMEALSPINDTEKAWLTPQKQEEGHRLACQSEIIKDDLPIKLTTRIQVLLNIFTQTFNESAEKKGLKPNPEALKNLIEYIGKETVAHLATTPAAVTNSMFRMIEGDYKPEMVYEALLAWREQTQDIKPDIQQLRHNIEKMAENKPEIPEISKWLEPLIESSKPIFSQVTDVVSSFIEAKMPGAPKEFGTNQVHRIPIEKAGSVEEKSDK